MEREDGTIAAKLVVLGPKDHSANASQVEGVGTHNAGFDGDEDCALGQDCPVVDLSDAVDLAVGRRVLPLRRQVV